MHLVFIYVCHQSPSTNNLNVGKVIEVTAAMIRERANQSALCKPHLMLRARPREEESEGSEGRSSAAVSKAMQWSEGLGPWVTAIFLLGAADPLETHSELA